MSLIGQLRTRALQLKREVWALYLAARHPNTPWYAKLFVIALVAYALSPIDLIPDFIPVLGLLDELILLPLGIGLAMRMVPASVMAECRARALADATFSSRAGRVGAVVIVMLWLILIIVVAIWAHSAFAHEGGREMTSTPINAYSFP
jgi:uncharacterized membrane protein YkvA (DUF1232 family)